MPHWGQAHHTWFFVQRSSKFLTNSSSSIISKANKTSIISSMVSYNTYITNENIYLNANFLVLLLSTTETSVTEGPNYPLVKRLQHWRAIVAREKGCFVSSDFYKWMPFCSAELHKSSPRQCISQFIWISKSFDIDGIICRSPGQ